MVAFILSAKGIGQLFSFFKRVVSRVAPNVAEAPAPAVARLLLVRSRGYVSVL